MKAISIKTRQTRVAVAFTAALIFSTLFSVAFKWLQKGDPFNIETLVYGATIFLNILIVGHLGYYMLDKFSEKSSAEIRRKIIPSYVLFVLSALVISLLIVSAGVFAMYKVNGDEMSGFLNHLFRIELNSAVRQFAFWIALSSILFFYIIWRKAIIREQKLLEERNLMFKYQNLKSQVNPHFLFNSLNTLSEIVYEDAKTADLYIRKLSNIYRYILEHEEVNLVPLQEEITFVQEYIDLQKIRDQDKIQLEWHATAANCQVVPVSVQVLVENALKHNARSVAQPLQINIFTEQDNVVVTNTIQRKSILEKSSKTGLANLSARVQLVLKRDLIVEERPHEFIVKLPMVNQ